ncbi:MAG: mannose-1-phosphate guanylyltransferase [Lentisphaeria bacterium]|nr:mannose-1-phosphate guanylyltransferase [Lentisphaeria bacterium]
MKIAKDKIFAVIMAGGKGERLWPLSTEERPKPLIALNGQQTLLEDTVQRLFPLLSAENVFVITDEKSAVQAREILMLPPENIIAEPCRRNTAPCIALAAALIQRKCQDATMIVLPADHRITPVKRFQEDLIECIDQAQNDSLTILGVPPDKPATGYGYINAGEKIASGIYKVNAFKEKPDFETAQHYMMDGNYWWNCGIFVWQVKVIAEAFQKYNPALFEKFEAWAKGSEYQKDFETCEKISIDYAVMEKASNVVVKQASFQWNDLGTLGALYEITRKDFHENAISAQGRIQLDDADQNLIFCDDDTEIRLEKIKKCAVIKSGKALLITSKW